MASTPHGGAPPPGHGPRPLPAGFRIALDQSVRRPRPDVLIGGSPMRILRLKPAGGRLVDAWLAGAAVGSKTAEQRVAGRLVDTGIAHPIPPPGVPPIDVAVVIPVRDDQDGLDATLASLASLRSVSVLAVTVVDDGSSTPPVAADATVIKRDACGGPAAARNTGWQAGPDAEMVLFVDAGCTLDAACVERLVAHFADPLVAAAAPRVASHGGDGALGCYEARRSPLDLGPRPSLVAPGGSIAYVPTAVLAVRRSALEALSGFDEAFRYGEDVDFIWRLAKAGWRIRYEPGGLASHPVRSTPTSWLSQRFGYGSSAAPLAERHGRAVAPMAGSRTSTVGWLLAAWGHPAWGAAIAAGGSAMLGRRIGVRSAESEDLAFLALRGHLRTGAALASALRRAWLPPALVALLVAPHRRKRRVALGLLAAFVVPALVDWRKCRPGRDPLSWMLLSCADDLAYQAGVWYGVIDYKSAAALLPRWS